MHPTDGDLPTVASAAGLDHMSLVNMVLLESVLRYRSDARFARRFGPDRVSGVSLRVESALADADYYDADLEAGERLYRMLKPKP